MAKKENNVADKLFIAELIRKVHDELILSQKIRVHEKKAPIFTVKDLTIEVNFVATEVSNKKGGLDFKIITAGANKEYSTQQIHRIVLNLELNKKLVDDKENKPIREPIQKATAQKSSRDKSVIGVNPIMIKGVNPPAPFGRLNELDDDPSHI